uniref:N-acetyl-gamma-glutamyl-phosphate reductase n=1 Tax=uncultured Erythrobacter sp. TaxID=263913 RepID=UPI00262D4171|nr:N-acetyl-gamma-glutamyl-phosphate reductase [uncultured Erythrobacter sp.]
MTTRIFIDGAAGTTGLEIRDRLAGREEFELIVLSDDRRKDEDARRDALHAADIGILCLPDGAARDAVALVEGADTRIIDASSAHRVAKGWTYGFPELIGHDAIAEAQFVSNPGCYPTGFLALVAPLIKAAVLPAEWPYTVNAVSGYSGGGNALIDRFDDDQTIAFRAYGLALTHKHLPEMKAYAGLTNEPVFSPSVVPAHRGMLVDVPLPLSAMPGATSAAFLESALTGHYAGSGVVHVHAHSQPPAEMLVKQGAEPWDGLGLHVFTSEDGAQARLIAMLDNLGKGASGAAIQNLNIMCGLPETTGLRL